MSSEVWETSILRLQNANLCHFEVAENLLSTLTFASPRFKFDRCLLHRVGR